jgi:hypothetical protein
MTQAIGFGAQRSRPKPGFPAESELWPSMKTTRTWSRSIKEVRSLSGVVGDVFWVSKNVMVRPVGPCADWYNVYKLTTSQMTDLDGDGVADDYGSCFQPDLVENQAPDSTPPPEGFTGSYLVTGENDIGEGSTGYAGNGLPRPNYSPCP